MFSACRTLEAENSERGNPPAHVQVINWAHGSCGGIFMDLSRLTALTGTEAAEKLKNSHVMIFGLGGVGGYTAEALARSGVGALTPVDFDSVSPSNINRQLCALESTLGLKKAEVLKERLLDINPDLNINAICERYTAENSEKFFALKPDYIVDAIDCITDKLDLICKATELDIPIISAMGAGNKLDGGAFRVSDIYKTKVCPLAQIMRRELRKRGIKKLKVVYSEELPVIKSRTPASAAWVVGAAGLMLAGEVVKDIINK